MNRDEKFIYENARGQSIEFSLWSPFLLSNIDGIDGLKTTIFTTKGMNEDGATYVGSTVESRNIIFQGAIEENRNSTLNREKLLKILNPTLSGKLTYINKDIKKTIDCRIEQAPIISKDNIPKFMISFLCSKPYWKDEIFIKKEIAIWVGNFKFPLTIPPEGIKLGHREPSLIVNITNNGDVPCGMRIEFRALGALKNPSLFNIKTRKFIKIDKAMVAGEKITVVTEFGNKKAISDFNGVISDAINYIDILTSTFLQLEVGDNLFRYDVDENIDNLEVSIYYTPQYVGV